MHDIILLNCVHSNYVTISQFYFFSGLQTDNCIEEFLSIAETLNGYGAILFDIQVRHTLYEFCFVNRVH